MTSKGIAVCLTGALASSALYVVMAVVGAGSCFNRTESTPPANHRFEISQEYSGVDAINLSTATKNAVVSRCDAEVQGVENCLTRELILKRSHISWPDAAPVTLYQFYAGQEAFARKQGDAFRDDIMGDHPEVRIPTTDVKDQASRGTCYAFANVAAIESLFLQRTGRVHDFSEQYVDLYTRHIHDNTTSFRVLANSDVFPIAPIPLEDVLPYELNSVKVLSNEGLSVTESWSSGAVALDIPTGSAYLPPQAIPQQYVEAYDTSSVAGDLSLAETNALLRAALDAGRAGVLTFYVQDTFDGYSDVSNDAVVDMDPRCDELLAMVASERPTDYTAQYSERCIGRGLHTVELIGYRIRGGKTEYLIKNSWGTAWGMAGYGWLSDRYAQFSAWPVGLIGGARFLEDGEFVLDVFPRRLFVESAPDVVPAKRQSYVVNSATYAENVRVVAGMRRISDDRFLGPSFGVLQTAGESREALIAEGFGALGADDEEWGVLNLKDVTAGDAFRVYDYIGGTHEDIVFAAEDFVASDDELLSGVDRIVLWANGSFLSEDDEGIASNPLRIHSLSDTIYMWVCRGVDYCVANTEVTATLTSGGTIIGEHTTRSGELRLLHLTGLFYKGDAAVAGSSVPVGSTVLSISRHGLTKSIVVELP